ncbi:MAG: hypothetical protein HUU41_04930 [Bryobacteraceae bacterium]|nr:LPS assembly lipoprotein LptE [Bryobacterales bacterium]MEB2362714.1 LPS assembly lipoprotein LptE [Bryobacterales bacterium]NUN00436.1 hypothetical protein [Bryobacteraceae bacterium]
MKTAAALAAALLASAGCGYRVAGRPEVVPPTTHVIAIPAFQNLTSRPKLADRIASALTREFIARTKYHVSSDPDTADVIMDGAVTNYASYPEVFDPITGRASGVQIIVTLHISLRERTTGKILFARPGLVVRERYEISVSELSYFEESDTAGERLSRDVARGIVSAILTSF